MIKSKDLQKDANDSTLRLSADEMDEHDVSDSEFSFEYNPEQFEAMHNQSSAMQQKLQQDEDKNANTNNNSKKKQDKTKKKKKKTRTNQSSKKHCTSSDSGSGWDHSAKSVVLDEDEKQLEKSRRGLTSSEILSLTRNSTAQVLPPSSSSLPTPSSIPKSNYYPPQESKQPSTEGKKRRAKKGSKKPSKARTKEKKQMGKDSQRKPKEPRPPTISASQVLSLTQPTLEDVNDSNYEEQSLPGFTRHQQEDSRLVEKMDTIASSCSNTKPLQRNKTNKVKTKANSSGLISETDSKKTTKKSTKKSKQSSSKKSAKDLKSSLSTRYSDPNMISAEQVLALTKATTSQHPMRGAFELNNDASDNNEIVAVKGDWGDDNEFSNSISTTATTILPGAVPIQGIGRSDSRSDQFDNVTDEELGQVNDDISTAVAATDSPDMVLDAPVVLQATTPRETPMEQMKEDGTKSDESKTKDEGDAEFSRGWNLMTYLAAGLCVLATLLVVLILLIFLRSDELEVAAVDNTGDTSSTSNNDNDNENGTEVAMIPLLEFLIEKLGGIEEGSHGYQAYDWLSTIEKSIPSDSDDDFQYGVLERYALATFYFATNGALWSNNENWLSNEATCNWYSNGADCSSNINNHRIALDLRGNNLSGTIPSELGLITKLTSLLLMANADLTGTMPSSLGALTNLNGFVVDNTGVTGRIPEEYSQWTDIRSFHVGITNVTKAGSPQLCAAIDQLVQQNLLEEKVLAARCGESIRDSVCECCTHCCSDVNGCSLNCKNSKVFELAPSCQ